MYLRRVTEAHTRLSAFAGHGSAGLTLIELLVGLVILGVLLGAVTLAFPDSGARRTELAAERLQAWLQLACERAEVTGRDIGIGIARQRVAFGPMHGGRWQTIADSPAEVLRPRRVDAAIRLDLRVDERALVLADALPTQPQLACLSSGEWTPFVLAIIGPGQTQWRLRGDAEGGLSRERSDASR